MNHRSECSSELTSKCPQIRKNILILGNPIKFKMRKKQCETLMASNATLEKLNHTDYDLVLADPSVPCGELLAAKENVANETYSVRQIHTVRFPWLLLFLKTYHLVRPIIPTLEKFNSKAIYVISVSMSFLITYKTFISYLNFERWYPRGI